MASYGHEQLLSAEEEAQLLSAFRAADKKKAGVITLKMLRDILEVLQQAPLTNEQFYIITADADLEGSGEIDADEFRTVRCCPYLWPWNRNESIWAEPEPLRSRCHLSFNVPRLRRRRASVHPTASPKVQCCLKWKKTRARKGQRITKEVVNSLVKDGVVDLGSLDSMLSDFGLEVSLKERLARRKIVPKEGETRVNADQLLAAMRQSNS